MLELILGCLWFLLLLDLRPAPMIENMVSIYKSLDATLGSFHLHVKASAAGVNGWKHFSLIYLICDTLLLLHLALCSLTVLPI